MPLEFENENRRKIISTEDEEHKYQEGRLRERRGIPTEKEKVSEKTN